MGINISKLSTSYIKVEKQSEPTELKTIPDCLRHYAATRPDREAFVFASTDGTRQAVTWKELYNQSCLVAGSLIRLGVKRDEFVAINIPNCPEWLFLTFGTMMIRARPISIAFTYTDGSDVVAMMEKLGTCSMLAVSPGPNEGNWKIVNNLVDKYSSDGSVTSDKMPFLRYLVCHDCPENNGDVKTLRGLMSEASTETVLPEVDPNDIATLFQTSGSTGVPKFVAHTHKSFMIGTGFNVDDVFSSDDIFFNDRPFSWIGGSPLNVLIGQTRVTRFGFCPDPEDKVSFSIDVIKREKCTLIGVLSPVIRELMIRKEELKENWPVKKILTGAQPITANMAECVGTLCDTFMSVYGATECSFMTVVVINSSSTLIEYAAGTPIRIDGSEIKIADDNGDVLPINTRGEIYIRSNGLFKEYYNDLKKTRAVMTDDGWYKTDDMGHMTEDGVLFVDGRKSNMILSGGFNVAPEILEKVIASCPGVEFAVIVPVPDNLLYQVICACVILEKGSDVTEETIRNFCAEIHNDKQRLFTVLPKYYMIMDTFPELSTGKVSRKILTEMATKMFLK